MSLFDCCLTYCIDHYDEIKTQLNILPKLLQDKIKLEHYDRNLTKFSLKQNEYRNEKLKSKEDYYSNRSLEFESFLDYYNENDLLWNQGQKIIVYVGHKSYLYHINYYGVCECGCRMSCSYEPFFVSNEDISTYRQLISLIDDLQAINNFTPKERRSLYVLDLVSFIESPKIELDH